MSGTDAITQLEKLGELKSKGILTEAEFEAKKKELLSPVVQPETISTYKPKGDGALSPDSVPLDQKAWFVYVCLICVFPLGVWLLSRKRIYKMRGGMRVPISVGWKWANFIAALLLFLWSIARMFALAAASAGSS